MTLHVVVLASMDLQFHVFCGYAETTYNVPVMIKYIRNLFYRKSIVQLSGEIRLCVDMSIENSISFRIDGRKMQVEWGDGDQSSWAVISKQFSHQYTIPAHYKIRIRGEGIITLDIPGCHVTDLDVSACKTLEFINCSNNQLSVLDMRKCKHLYELHCLNNQLTELKLGKYSNLFNLVCSFNQLKDIDISGCPNLVDLYCNDNCIQALDVSRCRKLFTVHIEDNAFDQESLMSLISGLHFKRKKMPGILCIGCRSRHDRHLIEEYLLRKGWCEI